MVSEDANQFKNSIYFFPNFHFLVVKSMISFFFVKSQPIEHRFCRHFTQLFADRNIYLKVSSLKSTHANLSYLYKNSL